MTGSPPAPSLDAQYDHEQLVVFRDAPTGLTGAIAIHSSVLGPATGGLRLAGYPTLDAAAGDALALSRAMTLKNAAAGLDLGGGKAVVVDDGRWGERGLRTRRMKAFGRVLDRLEGRYVTAEDVGTTPQDMDVIAGVTRHVIGVSARSGDPSAATARTVFGALAAAVAVHLDRDLAGARIGVLGVGHVGSRLAALLAASGAEVCVSDIDRGRAARVAEAIGATAIEPDGIVTRPLDVLAPCALGGAIRAADVMSVGAWIICGAANNPLEDDTLAQRLHDAGILYVPDFLANCGGIIHVGAEVLGFDRREVERRLDAAATRVRSILETAAATGDVPLDLARRAAVERLRRAPGSAAATAVA